jgi:tRNA pseudouridine(38-40) synthase
VSALGNALVLTSGYSGPVLLRMLNGIAPDIVFTAARPVTDSFRVRSAVRRVYRYFEPQGSHDFRRWPAAARRFSGEVDVRSFGRGVPSGFPVWRNMESVTVTPRPGGAEVEVRAPSFVWGMVRKIVAALREVDAGRLSVEQLESALHGQTRLMLPLAEPERLVLWDVEYSVPWEFHWNGPNRHQLQWERSAKDDFWVRQAMLELFAAGSEPPDRSRED